MTTSVNDGVEIEATAEYARVALDLPIESAYQYSLPEAMRGQLPVGSIVSVPVRGRTVRGCVVELESRPATKTVKPVTERLSAPFTLDLRLLELARWMSNYYMAPFGETLRTVSFMGFSDAHRPVEKLLCLADPDHWILHPGDEAPDGKKITANQKRVVDLLAIRANEPMAPALLESEAEVSDAVVGGLLKRGILERIEAPAEVEDDYAAATAGPIEIPRLNTKQHAALEEIGEALRDKAFRTFLLYGVTGSGKTEVYLQAIEEALRQGRQAIVLAPEISLTPQTVERFRARFGDIVGVYHHRQTLRQKFNLWERIHDGRIKIVVGARSAVFTPFPSLGVIVVDEEHSQSYKQGASPRYHARDVALMRAKESNAVAILGSATPSMESFHNAKSGKYRMLELPSRIGDIPLPAVELIDMGRELKKTHANPGVLSTRLRDAIEERLLNAEQTLLLLNRRGHSSVSMCLSCEYVERCEQCDSAMTYHRTHGNLVCHLCGSRRKREDVCKVCGEKGMALIGVGTQKAEETLKALYPTARTIRLDGDSVRGRTAWQEAWEKLNNGEVDLILGTQMIAKGLHLEGVTLAGIISADSSLFQGDFRAAERTFSLLAQAAGRAGRKDKPGEVIIQTYSPSHYAIQFACKHDYEGFYEKEMQERIATRFPPVQRLISLLVTCEEDDAARAMAGRLAGLLRNLGSAETFEGATVLGPAPCCIERVRGKWRWRVLVRSAHTASMHELVRAGLVEFERVAGRGKVGLEVDVDPQDLL